MGRKQSPGLFKRGDTWHIDKCIQGRRIRQSTGTSLLAEAETFLARLTEEFRQAQVYGIRPTRTFEQAAAKFVMENQHKRSIDDDISRLKGIVPWIRHIPIHKIHMGTLQPWIEARRKGGVSIGTINHGLAVMRRIFNLAAGEWVDEVGLTWLQAPPKIKLIPNTNKRQPYPLNWEEQARLFEELPSHLEEMALFAVNTGGRDSEIVKLLWSHEVQVPELNTSVFIIPGSGVKKGDDRLIVLNHIAFSVIANRRGQHLKYVFTYRGKPVSTMHNSAWKKGRLRAGLRQVRVHDPNTLLDVACGQPVSVLRTGKTCLDTDQAK